MTGTRYARLGWVMTVSAVAAFSAFARRPVPAWDQPHFRMLFAGQTRLAPLGVVPLIVRVIKGRLTHPFASGVLAQVLGLGSVDTVLLVLTSELRDDRGQVRRNAWLRLLWRNLRECRLCLLLRIHDGKNGLHVRRKLWHRHHWGRLRLGGLLRLL